MGTLCLKALPKKGPRATACRWVLMYWSNSYRTSAAGGAGGQAADQVTAGMSRHKIRADGDARQRP